jgi:preprotein translocase subunit SecG
VGPYLNIIQIIISITLIAIILLQVKGGAPGGAFGGPGVARTRRGLEKTLFDATIVLSAIFLLISLLSAVFAGRI